MTKAHENPENEFTDAALREAARTGREISAILAEWLEAAKKDRDKERAQKIIKAQKYLRCRNIRKRKGSK